MISASAMHEIHAGQPFFPPNPGSTTEVCYATPRAIGPKLPGDDWRTRKSYNSSHDQPDSPLDGFIEEDLRAGGPCLCPLPFQTPAVPKSSPIAHRIMQAYHLTRFKVRDILRSRHIKVRQISYLLNTATDRECTYSIPTVNITAIRHSLDEPWLEATREVYAFLASHGFPDLAVDMRDPALSHLRFAGLLKSDLADPFWNPLFKRLADAPDDDEIFGREVCRFGYRSVPRDNPLTLVVKICERSRRDWRPYREKLVDMLDKLELFHLAVSIIKICGLDGGCGNCRRTKRKGMAKEIEDNVEDEIQNEDPSE